MRRGWVLVSLGGLLAGCGSGAGSRPAVVGSDAEQIHALFRGYAFAVADQNASSACKLWTPGFQRRFVSAVVSATGQGQGLSCAQVLGAAFHAQPTATAREGRDFIRHGRLVHLRIRGDRARATLRVTIGSAEVSNGWAAERVDGHWLMSCCLPRAPAR